MARNSLPSRPLPPLSIQCLLRDLLIRLQWVTTPSRHRCRRQIEPSREVLLRITIHPVQCLCKRRLICGSLGNWGIQRACRSRKLALTTHKHINQFISVNRALHRYHRQVYNIRLRSLVRSGRRLKNMPQTSPQCRRSMLDWQEIRTFQLRFVSPSSLWFSVMNVLSFNF
jgi:hypothetical protein